MSEELKDEGMPAASADKQESSGSDSGTPPVAGTPTGENQQAASSDGNTCPQGTELEVAPEVADGTVTEVVRDSGVSGNVSDPQQGEDASSCAAEEQPGQQDSASAEPDQASPVQEQPEDDDPFCFTYESEEEKRQYARLWASYDEMLGRGGVQESGAEPDAPVPDPQAPDPEPEAPKPEPYQPPPTLALVRREGEIRVARIEWHDGCPKLIDQRNQYYTPAMPCSVYRSMRLPTAVVSCPTAREAYLAIYDVLKDCSFLSERQCELLSFWCLATWFSDELDFTPRLSVTGPPFAVELLFTLLTYVCNKAITIVGMSPVILKQIAIEKLNPTLLIYQVKPSKSATELLVASDHPGRLIACGGELVQFSCAKAVYLGQDVEPKQIADSLHVHLAGNAPVPERPYRSAAAIEELQNKLLAYRSFNRKRTSFLRVSAGELQPQLDVFSRRLGAAIVNDARLQHRLIEILKEQSEQVRAERACGLEGCVLQAALSLSHGEEGQAYTGKIAAVAKQVGIDQGEAMDTSPEKVGRALNRLGLYTRRLGSQGRGLVFDKATQLRIHEMCREYALLPLVPGCGYCQLMRASEGK